MTTRVVSSLLGVPLRYYVLVDFNGFKRVVDALGGVTIDVEQDMYHEDPEDNRAYQIDLKKGLQRLDGDKALQYVRYRGYPLADIERTQHQQKFLAALLHEVTQPSAVLKLPVLVPELYRCVKTNLSLTQIYQLAQAARKLEGSKMLAQTLPGYPVMIDDISYWAVDPAEAKLALGRLLNGETTEVVRSAPVNPNAIGASGSGATQSPSRPKEESASPPLAVANKLGAAGSKGSGPLKPPENAKTNPESGARTEAKKADSDKTGKSAPAGTAQTAGKGAAENKTSAALGGPSTPQSSPPLISGTPRQPVTAP